MLGLLMFETMWEMMGGTLFFKEFPCLGVGYCESLANSEMGDD